MTYFGAKEKKCDSVSLKNFVLAFKILLRFRGRFLSNARLWIAKS